MRPAPATLHEALAVAVARRLRDGDVGWTGLTTGGRTAMYGTTIPIAAMEMARRTHAPNLTLLLAGWCHNPDLSGLAALPRSEFPLSWSHLECDAHKTGWPGMHAVYRGDIDIGFASAAQIDRRGNLNTVAIGKSERPDVRLVGPVMVTEHMAFFGREIVMMPTHEARTFVDSVDYLSALGHGDGPGHRRELGLPGAGPELVVTPKCVFDFDERTAAMRVSSIHPDVTADELRASTGFDLGDLSSVPTTAAPSVEELEILRSEVDPHGFLREGSPEFGGGSA
jgi:glutaconate CoA-transferase subunit B